MLVITCKKRNSIISPHGFKARRRAIEDFSKWASMEDTVEVEG